MKLLVWEDNGFWLHFKRLEKGCFDWPDIIADENKMNLCYEDLINLIKAPGIKVSVKAVLPSLVELVNIFIEKNFCL